MADEPELAIVKRARVAAWVIAGIIASALLTDYAYYDGFDDGADAMLCVEAISIDGPAKAEGEQPCLHIKSRKAVPRIFPGSNGDEPTIWNTRAGAKQ